MQEQIKYPAPLVYGLDIGTRSIVGTVGYRIKDHFYVVAQKTIEHETRAVIDGQIHDITAVSVVIRDVTDYLESKVQTPLKAACIAAAGRVLRTVTTHVEIEFESEKLITKEDVYTLDSYGVEKAYEQFQKENELDMKFYCVGYSTMKYFLNDYPMGNLENHKAKAISEDLIATFLPDDVVDGLYKAVELAGLEVANLTLEPIAAIEVAIPERFRMLNIALVDVGAGTSDISITKDGSIIAYGMLPVAGDSLTEIIARHCLVDFVTAEEIKRGISDQEQVSYKDIMGLTQTIPREEVLNLLEDAVSHMSKLVAEKITELNGGKAVSAVFVVGGGGKVENYTDRVASFLGIPKERCAIRGEDVMQKIEFLEKDIVKDSILVTPIGICLNFYEKSNNFVIVTFNDKRVKLYDNSKLAIVDAAMQADYPNDGLFPKRGTPLKFSVNGKPRVIRGEAGEAATIYLNGSHADIHTPIRANDIIVVEESTAGAAASLEIGKLPEYSSNIMFIVNDKKIDVPKFASVNGMLQSPYYSIHENDAIEMLNYYTVKQIIELMDVVLDKNMNLYVNNKVADLETKVYENFSVIWTLEKLTMNHAVEPDILEEQTNHTQESQPDVAQDNKITYDVGNDILEEPKSEPVSTVETVSNADQVSNAEPISTAEPVTSDPSAATEPVVAKKIRLNTVLQVVVNDNPVKLFGKPEYVFVDAFEFIDFDLTKPQGTSVVTKINGNVAQYMEPLNNGDVLEIFWKQ